MMCALSELVIRRRASDGASCLLAQITRFVAGFGSPALLPIALGRIPDYFCMNPSEAE